MLRSCWFDELALQVGVTITSWCYELVLRVGVTILKVQITNGLRVCVRNSEL